MKVENFQEIIQINLVLLEVHVKIFFNLIGTYSVNLRKEFHKI